MVASGGASGSGASLSSRRGTGSVRLWSEKYLRSQDEHESSSRLSDVGLHPIPGNRILQRGLWEVGEPWSHPAGSWPHGDQHGVL